LTDPAIEQWITRQMKLCDVAIILVCARTASRRWIDYEIRHAWNTYKPIFGIRINGLKDSGGATSAAGVNPFKNVQLENGGSTLDSLVPLHTPAGGADSKAVYGDIQSKIVAWIKAAPARAK
jgi:hypothetical protein